MSACVIDGCATEAVWLVVSAPDIVTACDEHRPLCDDEWLEPTFLRLDAARAACDDGDDSWCCIESDGTGLWCGPCLSMADSTGNASQTEPAGGCPSCGRPEDEHNAAQADRCLVAIAEAARTARSPE